MKSTAKTIMVAAVIWMLLTPVQAAELESGFMDTKWSSPAKDLQGFTRVGGSGKIAYYVNPQRTYTFFGTEVPDDVVYGFYDDKFFAVYVNIEGIDVFSQIKSYIQHKYGVPSKTSRETRGDLTTYVWKLNQTQIKFKHHETSGKMKMSFYYLPIANQVNAEMKKDQEDEPPEPVFPLSAVRQSEAMRQQMEFMSF
ncbi:MAG: hypothetical protein E4H48_04710 [Syntrophobacterales bacterium]|nr:MAG: hypothetical protein E4H48_04710 [Syntrophobacterales bacterium]